ncbi:MAG: polysaccharide deacetylase family protein [Betaproteobacteria bacterium]|nr:polysaccharide deacetylase family protein [Betaproteobacteria bacterium]
MIALDRRIDYLPLNDRPRIRWPGNARIAFWVVPNVEHYEYLPPQGTAREPRGHDNPDFPAPNIPVAVRRDYGNRVGFWRMLKALDKYSIRCTVNINLAVLDHFPEERDAMVERSWDFCCHGVYNTRAAPKGMTPAEQRAFVRDSIAFLKRTTGKQLKGFNVLSRASAELPDILAEEGIIYHADYFHDDQPTPINVVRGKLVSIPYGAELNDSVMTSRNRPWELDTLFDMVRDAFDRLYAEGADNGMVLCLPVHPWCSGYPYRIRHLERILDYVMSHDGVWQATADEIAEHYIAHHYDDAVAHIRRLQAERAQRARERSR